MKKAFRTDTGKIRAHNEDSGGIFQTKNGVLAIVADGMGGHLAGDIASQMAVDYIKEQWEQVTNELTPVEAEQWLKQTISDANHRLYTYAEEHPDCKGMGTTLVTAICTDKHVTIAHIGDSRIYLLNENGFSLQTEDHSLVNELIKNGQLTKDEADMHPRKHVLLRALGTEKHIEADIRSLNWDQQDILLLCSDGLTNKVAEDVTEKIVRSDRTVEEKADELIALANQAGGDDNITIAIIKHTVSDGNEKDDGA